MEELKDWNANNIVMQDIASIHILPNFEYFLSPIENTITREIKEANIPPNLNVRNSALGVVTSEW